MSVFKLNSKSQGFKFLLWKPWTQSFVHVLCYSYPWIEQPPSFFPVSSISSPAMPKPWWGSIVFWLGPWPLVSDITDPKVSWLCLCLHFAPKVTKILWLSISLCITCRGSGGKHSICCYWDFSFPGGWSLREIRYLPVASSCYYVTILNLDPNWDLHWDCIHSPTI